MGLFGRAKQKDENTGKLQILLDRFEYPHLEALCADVIKRSPQVPHNERLERMEYVEYVWDQYKKGAFTFQQVMDFAVSQGIVQKDFFE